MGAGGDTALLLERAPSNGPSPVPRMPRYVWAVPAALSFAVSVAASVRPVLWQDELATLSATTRSLPALLRLTTHLDAVLGPYYALLHLWTVVAGHSPLALRLPSALAVAGAVGVAAVIGTRLWGPRAGLLTGLLLALSPTVTQYGAEARPYGLTLFAGCLATLALLGAVRTPTRAAWARYGGCVLLIGLLQVTGVLLVLAHLLALAALPRGERRPRLVGAAAAAGAALLLLTPVLVVGHLQKDQVDWIPQPTWGGVLAVPVRLWSAPGAAPSVLLATAVLLLAAAAVLGLRPAARDPGTALGLAVAVVPVAALGLVSLAVPLIRYRYLLYTQLGWALLAAAALTRLGTRAAVVLLAVLLALAVPAHRPLFDTLKAAGSPDYRTMAAVLAADARPGDALVVPTDSGVRFRVGLAEYLPAGDHLPTDVLVRRSADAAGSLDAKECRPGTCLGRPARLWVGCRGACVDPLASLRPETARQVRTEGYEPVAAHPVDGGGLFLFRPRS